MTKQTKPLTAAEQTAALLAGDAAKIEALQQQIDENKHVQNVADTPPADGANILALKAKAAETAKLAGAKFARGEGSLTNLAFYFSAGCRAGFLAESDAEMLYRAFVDGHNGWIDHAPSTGHEKLATDDKSLKVPVSIFRTFGKSAPVAMGEDFYKRVLTVRHGIGSSDRAGSAYNAMVTVNRRVVELGEKMAKVEVDDTQIAAWITKKPVATKDDVAKLEELVVKLAKMANANIFIGLIDPVAELEKFVAKVKLGQNQPKLTVVGGTESMTPGEVAAAEKSEVDALAAEIAKNGGRDKPDNTDYFDAETKIKAEKAA